MPYVTEQRKRELTEGGRMTTPGDLTYMLTRACLDPAMRYRLNDAFFTLVNEYLPHEGERRYADLAVVLGCLESTKLEFHRRLAASHSTDQIESALTDFKLAFYYTVVAPYEDQKIEANGDVFPS